MECQIVTRESVTRNVLVVHQKLAFIKRTCFHDKLQKECPDLGWWASKAKSREETFFAIWLTSGIDSLFCLTEPKTNQSQTQTSNSVKTLSSAMDAFVIFLSQDSFMSRQQKRPEEDQFGLCLHTIQQSVESFFVFWAIRFGELSLSKSPFDLLDVLFNDDRQSQRSLVRNTRLFDDAQIVTRSHLGRNVWRSNQKWFSPSNGFPTISCKKNVQT